MKIATGTDELLCEIRERVATVTLNRPHKKMFFSERVGAEECSRLGLVNAVFAAETFREDAFAYAKRLANGPTSALSRMKRNLNRGALQGLRESLALEAEHMVMSFQTEDAKEALRAFVEKREPRFRSR